MWSAFKIQTKRVFTQKGGQPEDQRGFANQIRTVHDEKPAIKGELLLYPYQGVVAAKEHLWAFGRPSRVVGVD